MKQQAKLFLRKSETAKKNPPNVVERFLGKNMEELDGSVDDNKVEEITREEVYLKKK